MWEMWERIKVIFSLPAIFTYWNIWCSREPKSFHFPFLFEGEKCIALFWKNKAVLCPVSEGKVDSLVNVYILLEETTHYSPLAVLDAVNLRLSKPFWQRKYFEVKRVRELQKKMPYLTIDPWFLVFLTKRFFGRKTGIHKMFQILRI